MKKIFIILFVSLFMIGLINATLNCDSIPDITYESGTPNKQQISFQCNNPPNLSTVTLSKSGTGIDYFDFDVGGKTITSPGTKTFKLSFDESAPMGMYSGKINFNDDTTTLTFIMDIKGTINPTNCQINPSIVSYNQDFQQGAKTTEIITFNPKNCNGDISISGANIQGGVIIEDGGISKRKPVSLGIVSSNEININVDTGGLPSKTYDDIKLTFNAYDSQHTIRFTIGVSGSAGGTKDLDINNLPTCSLTNNIININETHSLVCTNLITDIEIIPMIDNEYIRGINLEREANQWSWIFQGKNFGNTIIKAGFYFMGVPIGDFFEQEIKIQASSQQTPGTSLVLDFLPKLSEIKVDEDVMIQILDNKTKSLVEKPELYINSIPIENTTGKSFKYSFKIGEDYVLRAVSPGYDNLIQTINITSKTLKFTIIPDKEFYITGDLVNISSNVNETSFLINNEVIENPESYIFSTVGNFTIKSINEYYISAEKNVTVESAVFFSDCNSKYDKWKKGKNINCELSENSTWSVFIGGKLIESGDGDNLEFKISDYGYLEIRSGSYVIYGATIEKSSSWYNPFSWDFWGKIKWYYWLLGVLVIGGGWYYLDKKSDGEGTSFVMEG